jgi:demethylmenaquinone methyltransferase/2-methoxy-6-polyprenyl-1,4-benzoquinol methylase
VPAIGGLLSGDREAYRYLPASVEAFPDASALAALMQANGFEQVTFDLVGGGTVAIHVATKVG